MNRIFTQVITKMISEQREEQTNTELCGIIWGDYEQCDQIFQHRSRID